MIERLEAPVGVLAFKAVGEVGMDDYTQVIKPAIDLATTGGRKLRVVFVIGPEFKGHSQGARLEDLGLGLGFIRKVQRVAIVTDAEWIGDLMRRFGWMMGKRLKHFGLTELQAALQWAAE